MINKQQLILVLTALLAGFAVGRADIFENKSQPEERLAAEQVRATGIKMSIVSVADTSDKFFNIAGEYPQFDSMEEVNRQIKKMVDGTLAEYKDGSRQNWAARQATMPENERKEYPEKPFDFNLWWEPAQINGNYISTIVRAEYYAGGANMATKLQTFNYDVKNKKMFVLGDIFQDTPDYLQKLSNYARQKLAARLGEQYQMKANDPMLLAGTEPKAENFSNFTFDDSKITFYWAKYGVAPGAMGEQSVTLFKKDIPNLN